MCVEPTTALVIGSAVSSGIQYQTGKAQQKAEYQAQKNRNRLARENALQRYVSEQLKIMDGFSSIFKKFDISDNFDLS